MINEPPPIDTMKFLSFARSLREPIFYTLFTVVAAAPLARGDYNALFTSVGEYKSERTPAKGYHREWMKWLPDSIRISELSIPGTHDAGTESFFSPSDSEASDCQDAAIPQQLEAGVRFLDLRVEDTNGQWELHHSTWQYRRLDDVLGDIVTFLNEYPSETVLVRITPFPTDVNNFVQWAWPSYSLFLKKWIWPGERDDDGNVLYRADGVTPQTYAHHATGNTQDPIYDNSSFIWPTLGEVRGKMVMFLGSANPLLYQNKGHTSGLGYKGHDLDDNAFNSTKTYDGKIVMSCRDEYDNSDFGNKQSRDINHIGIASGTSSKDQLFVTGLNIGYSFGGAWPKTSAAAMNRYLLNQLNNPLITDWKKTGIVLLDFPGPALLDSIISLNFRHATNLDFMSADFKEFAIRVAWDQSLVNPSLNHPALLAANYRKLLKERIPFCEFNTLVTSLPAGGTFFSYTSTLDTDTNSLSFSVGPFTSLEQTASVFQSHRVPLTVTSDQVKTALDSLLARPDAATENKVNPHWIKQELLKMTNFDKLDLVVYVHQAIGGAVYTGFDFEPNVAYAEARYSFGSLLTYWLVAASEPQPVSTGVSYPAVVGQWDFNESDLTATIGEALVGSVTFPPYSSSGTMYIGNANGVQMTHGAAPNSGPSAARLNEWTLIMDLYLLESNSRRSLIQIDTLDNTTDGDLFISPEGGIGIDGVYHGKMETLKWHRVAIAVDATREQVISKYIDGELKGEQSIRPFDTTSIADPPGYSYSSRWSLMDKALLFGDSAGQVQNLAVDNIQFRNYKMSAAEVAALSGPSFAGIPNEIMTLSAEWADGPGLDTSSDFERMKKDLNKNQFKLSWNPIYQLQQSDSPGGPWVDVPTTEGWVDVPTTEGTRFFNTEGMTRKFFQLRSR